MASYQHHQAAAASAAMAAAAAAHTSTHRRSSTGSSYQHSSHSSSHSISRSSWQQQLSTLLVGVLTVAGEPLMASALHTYASRQAAAAPGGFTEGPPLNLLLWPVPTLSDTATTSALLLP
jgi:hypothetical protein